ncbi:MAG: hypothetical protein K6G73_12320 [Marinilabiliaceae bacterium]|nr:hypothetical protein [Marinilabiliaceae bacterium]
MASEAARYKEYQQGMSLAQVQRTRVDNALMRYRREGTNTLAAGGHLGGTTNRGTALRGAKAYSNTYKMKGSSRTKRQRRNTRGGMYNL